MVAFTSTSPYYLALAVAHHPESKPGSSLLQKPICAKQLDASPNVSNIWTVLQKVSGGIEFVGWFSSATIF